VSGGWSGMAQFRAVFDAALDAMLIADHERRFVEVNPAACLLLGRDRDDLLTLRIEDVSPPAADVRGAWEAFLAAGEASGEYTLVRPDGSAVEVEFRAKANVLPDRHLSILRDVSARKRVERERERLYETLREARDRERSVALTLQQALLPRAPALPDLDIATRYLPAAEGVNVCGDWYNVVGLGRRRAAVAVGDVMGHGLPAAGAMGQLSSALAAAMHADASPAEALHTLDKYARSVGSELLATVVLAVIDLDRRRLTYSSAGHPPVLLLGAHGAKRFLEDATAPPLASTCEPRRRPQATLDLPPAARLVLFTDGLIERRRRDIDEGLARLRDVAAHNAGLRAEALADAILREMLADEAPADDVALVVITT
jgi:PAS domain S-box-containing protein